MKIFIMTDIEGVAGVVAHASHSYSDGKYDMEFNRGAERVDDQTTRFVSESLADVFSYRHNPPPC
jgi:D-aminopeptidase